MIAEINDTASIQDINENTLLKSFATTGVMRYNFISETTKASVESLGSVSFWTMLPNMAFNLLLSFLLYYYYYDFLILYFPDVTS